MLRKQPRHELLWCDRGEGPEGTKITPEFGGVHTVFLNKQLLAKTALKKQREIPQRLTKGDPQLMILFEASMEETTSSVVEGAATSV